MRSPFRKNVLLLVIGCVFLAAGCGRASFVEPETIVPIPEWNGEDGKEISVTVNCSAYGRWREAWDDWYPPTFYIEPGEQTAFMLDGNYHTHNMRVPLETKELYVSPPRIALISELEEQLIPLNQEFPIQTEYFSVINADIPKLTEWNSEEKDIKVVVFLKSDNDQYPDFLSLRYDKKSYAFHGTSWEGDETGKPQYMSYICEMPDLYTAAMALKYGNLRYSKLLSIISAEDAVYECSDESVEIHLIK